MGVKIIYLLIAGFIAVQNTYGYEYEYYSKDMDYSQGGNILVSPANETWSLVGFFRNIWHKILSFLRVLFKPLHVIFTPLRVTIHAIRLFFSPIKNMFQAITATIWNALQSVPVIRIPFLLLHAFIRLILFPIRLFRDVMKTFLSRK